MSHFPEKILELWNGWEVRVLVQLSLLLQIFLAIFGARRKYTTKIWIRILVWSSYFSADWIATVLLSNLARSEEDSSRKSNALQTFWAPFLLLHLGGPDAITAYSLEDNELWLRHFLGLIVQVGLMLYIFVRSWSNNALTYIAIPIFITGLIKYGERTFVLRSSSSQYFKNLLLSDPDPGPDFVDIEKHIQGKPQPRCSPCPCVGKETDSDIDEVQRQSSAIATVLPPPPESLGAGFNHQLNQLDPEIQEQQKDGDYHQQQPPSTATALPPERSEASTSSAKPTETFISSLFSGRRWGRGGRVRRKKVFMVRNESSPRDNDLEVAYFLFNRFLYLFADMILSISERKESYSKFEKKSAKEAFKLVAVELGYMYDVLYTKVTINYSPLGILFRFISFCCTASALIAILFVDMHTYPPIDIYMTYILMISSVVLDIYAFIILLFSDWTRLCLTKLSSGCCHSSDRKRWSESMAQYNLISSCLRNGQPICNGIHNLPWIGELVDKCQSLTRKDVDVDLQDIIFKQLLQKSNEIIQDRFSIKSCKKLLSHRGDNVLKKRYNLLDISGWSISDVEFDHSLLLWHIATDLCYDSDGNDNTVVLERRISKYLSDYMLYLLVFCPFMLPDGITDRFRLTMADTLAECKRFFPEEKIGYRKFVVKRKKSIEKTEACKKLLGVKFGDEQEHIKGDKSQSVLFYGCRLAKQLQDLETAGWTREQKWKMISEVWVEMLTYAANKSRWKEHGQQLRRGGELLTHVYLLMAHLGFSKQYGIQKLFINEKLYGNVIQRLSWLRAPYNILCRLLRIPCYPCLQCYHCLHCGCQCLCCRCCKK